MQQDLLSKNNSNVCTTAVGGYHEITIIMKLNKNYLKKYL